MAQPKSLKAVAAAEANDFLKQLLAEHGIAKEDALEVANGEPVQSHELDDPPQRVMFRGQGVLRSLEYPNEARLTRVCKSPDCGAYFVTNYYSVAYCSILCMEQDLKKYFGLAWKPHARIKKERWEVQAEPEMIPMQALQAMKMIVTRVETDLGRPIEIDEQAFSQLPSGVLSEKKPSSASSQSQEVLPPLDIPQDQVQSERFVAVNDDSLSWLFS